MTLTDAIADAASTAHISEQGLTLAVALLWPTLSKPRFRIGFAPQKAEEIRQKAGEIAARRIP